MTRARDVANVLSAATALATDTETAAAISSHNSTTTSVHGITNTATLATQTYADSAVSTHVAAADPHTVYLKESEFSAAGKNKILNGDFSIWQRGVTGGNGFLADRWYLNAGAPTSFNQTRQAFTPGTAPVAGYEGKYFWRNTITTVGPSTEWYLNTYIEDVQTLAGQTATFSFWAKADSARAMSGYFLQRFGDGGSTTVSTTIGTASLTTSWQRFTFTISVPSLSGKTIGANNLVQIFFAMTPASGMVIDLWGVQLEAGSVATPFTTATGNQQAELAACQRYYWRSTPGSTYSTYANGMATSSTTSYSHMHFPVPMRISPTSVDYANVGFGDFQVGVINPNFVGLTSHTGTYGIVVQVNASGYTQYRPGQIMNNNNANGYLGFSAEL